MKEKFEPTIFGFNRKRSLNYGLFFFYKEDVVSKNDIY